MAIGGNGLTPEEPILADNPKVMQAWFLAREIEDVKFVCYEARS